jgi:hypothetical protein
LHLFEKLNFQIMVPLYFLGLVLDVYVPPPTPHLQLAPSMCFSIISYYLCLLL